MTKPILVMNGPNLNMLGTREPDQYGKETLSQIALNCEEKARDLGLEIDFQQSNSEGEMVTILQQAGDQYAGIIINPAAYTHTSVAIRDALLVAKLPIIEVHLSNIHKREEFRHHSYVSDIAEAVICGCGGLGYLLAIEALNDVLSASK